MTTLREDFEAYWLSRWPKNAMPPIMNEAFRDLAWDVYQAATERAAEIADACLDDDRVWLHDGLPMQICHLPQVIRSEPIPSSPQDHPL